MLLDLKYIEYATLNESKNFFPLWVANHAIAVQSGPWMLKRFLSERFTVVAALQPNLWSLRCCRAATVNK